MRYRPRKGTYIGARTKEATSVVEVVNDDLAAFTQALLDLFTRSNSILAGQAVQCIASPVTKIACTDGEKVYFNPDVLNKAFSGANKNRLNVKSALATLSEIRGVNLHELAHIMFSPRANSVAWNSVQKLQQEIDQSEECGKYMGVKAQFVWNLLEDQRIESLFSSKYRNSVPYFQSTVTQLLLGDPNAKVELIHLWIHGRRYMPLDIRRQARELFQRHFGVSDYDLNTWEKVIDDYRTFVFPRDGRQLPNTIKIFMELWVKYIPQMFPDDWGTTGGNGRGGHGERREGSPDTSEQREAQEYREEADEHFGSYDDDNDDEESDESGDSVGGDSDDSDDDADDDAESNADGDSDGEGDSQTQGGARPSDSDATGKPNSSNDVGNGKSDSNDAQTTASGNVQGTHSGGGLNSGQGAPTTDTGNATKLLKSLENTLAQASDAVQNDSMETLKQVLHKVRGVALDNLLRGIEEPANMVPPTAKFRAISNALNTALRQLRSDAEPMWERSVPTGRLNIDLVVKSEATDTDMDVFDRWVDSGDDAPRVEVVILLDQSGSMSTSIPTSESTGYYSVMHEASASVWAIKLACQQNEIPCTVIGYSEDEQTSCLMTADTRVNPSSVGMYEAKNNTHPDTALRLAQTVFSRSDATHKILVSVSDGEWPYYGDTPKLVGQLNGMGVETIFVALPSRYKMVYVRNEDGVTTATKYEPDFARGLDTYQAFGHKALIRAANPAELAKKIGKTLVRASL